MRHETAQDILCPKGSWLPNLTQQPPDGARDLVPREVYLARFIGTRVRYLHLAGPPLVGKTSLEAQRSSLLRALQAPADARLLYLPLEDLVWPPQGKKIHFPSLPAETTNKVWQMLVQQLSPREANVLLGARNKAQIIQRLARKKAVVIFIDNAEWLTLSSRDIQERFQNFLETLLTSPNLYIVLAGRSVPDVFPSPHGFRPWSFYLGGFNLGELKAALEQWGVPPAEGERLAKILYQQFGSNPYIAFRRVQNYRHWSKKDTENTLEETYWYFLRYLALRYPQKLDQVTATFDLASQLLLFSQQEWQDLARRLNRPVFPSQELHQLIEFLRQPGMLGFSSSFRSFFVPAPVAFVVNARNQMQQPKNFAHQQSEIIRYYTQVLQDGISPYPPATFYKWLAHYSVLHQFPKVNASSIPTPPDMLRTILDSLKANPEQTLDIANAIQNLLFTPPANRADQEQQLLDRLGVDRNSQRELRNILSKVVHFF